MKLLTKAEEQVMQGLWQIKKGYMGDLLEALAHLQLHRNTVATVIKILIEKEFVGVEVVGRSHLYFPLISKEVYSKARIRQFVQGYFNGSYEKVVSFFVKEKNISVVELEQLLNNIKQQQNKER